MNISTEKISLALSLITLAGIGASAVLFVDSIVTKTDLEIHTLDVKIYDTNRDIIRLKSKQHAKDLESHEVKELLTLEAMVEELKSDKEQLIESK